MYIDMLRGFRILSCARFGTESVVKCASFSRLTHSKSKENSSDGCTTEKISEKREQFNNVIPLDHLNIKFSRSPGPGGQNVNKVNTKVDVRFHVMTAQWLPFWIRQKVHRKEVNRINKDGELVIQSNKYRTQKQNLEDAVGKINNILKDVSHIPKETSPEKKDKIAKLMKAHDERRLIEKQFRTRRKRDRSNNE